MILLLLLFELSLLPFAPAGVKAPAETGGLCPLLPLRKFYFSFEAEFKLELNDYGP